MLKRLWNLQLFAEGEADTGASEGESVPVDTGVDSEDAAQNLGEETVDATQEETEEPETNEVSFGDLINGEYKDDFKKETSKIIKKRVKKFEDQIGEYEAKKKTLEPMLGRLAEKYGVENGDYEALNQAIMDDDAMYEEKALALGVDIPTAKSMDRMERENAELRAEQEAKLQEEQNREFWDGIIAQVDGVKEIYPDFDLDEEMLNDKFATLLGAGFNLKNAYESVHIEELQAKQSKAVADVTAKKMANAIKSGSKRPAENGVKHTIGTKVANDPSGLSLEEIDDVIARSAKGEEISF